MLKRVAAFISAGLATLSFFSFISTAVAGEQAVIRLWNWHVHDKKYTLKMVKLFNERNPNIKMEYSSIGQNYAQLLEAAYAANDPPDIFYPSGAITFQKLQTKGWIVPVNDIASNANEFKEWLSKFPSEIRQYAELQFGGKVYEFNLGGETSSVNPLFWNKTLFKEAGLSAPPKIQKELRQAADKLTQAGQGKSFGIIISVKGGSGDWHYSLTGSIVRFAGARGVDAQYFGGWDFRDGKYHIAGPEFTTALKLWVDMRKDGSVFPGETLMDEEQVKMLFATNKAGLEFGGWWNPTSYLAYNPDADFDVELPPFPDDGIRRGYHYVLPPGTAGSSGGYVVSSATKNPKAVWEWIKFMCSLEYQVGYVQGGYGISFIVEANKPENFAIRQMAKFAGWAKDPSLRRVCPVLSEEAGKIFDYIPPVYPPFYDVLTNVYLEKSGFDALKDLENKWNLALDEGVTKAQAAGLKITKADLIFSDWDISKDYVQKKK